MADRVSPPWRLPCPWCPFYVEVGARGGHGHDQGAGVEAADLMTYHVGAHHGRTWSEFLAAGPRDAQDG